MRYQAENNEEPRYRHMHQLYDGEEDGSMKRKVDHTIPYLLALSYSYESLELDLNARSWLDVRAVCWLPTVPKGLTIDDYKEQTFGGLLPRPYVGIFISKPPRGAAQD